VGTALGAPLPLPDSTWACPCRRPHVRDAIAAVVESAKRVLPQQQRKQVLSAFKRSAVASKRCGQQAWGADAAAGLVSAGQLG
jgi:hypothetical protein